MGKYMRKCRRGAGELAATEVTQVVGVRTRARTIAESADKSKVAAGKKTKLIQNVLSHEGVMQTSCLQLRSRSVVKTTRRVRQLLAENSGSDAAAAAALGMSRCCSNASSVCCESRNELVVENSPRCLESREMREAKDPSMSEAGDLESTAENKLESKFSTSMMMMPTEEEIEAFFAAAERDEKQRFITSYNYDVVKDEPLAGRYEWIAVKP